MKSISNYQRQISVIFCLLSLVFCLGVLSGCIRLTGTAGYTKVKEDEVVTKEAGFDLDSARLMQKSNQS